jgi:hypothetical protein
MNVWKGAVEYYPLWQALESEGLTIQPHIVWRPMDAVKESLAAKRQGRVDYQALDVITQKRYDILSGLAADYAFPVIETDNIVKGDLSSIQQAFEHYNHTFDPSLAGEVIKPEKWETDR